MFMVSKFNPIFTGYLTLLWCHANEVLIPTGVASNMVSGVSVAETSLLHLRGFR